MPTSAQASSNLHATNFATIFESALNLYKDRTGQDLRNHPFAISLENNNSPVVILAIFQRQAQAFDKFRSRNDKLMESLTPIVNILFALSATLGEGIGLVSAHSSHIMIIGPSNAISKAILTCQDHLYWYQSTPRGKCLSLLLIMHRRNSQHRW